MAYLHETCRRANWRALDVRMLVVLKLVVVLTCPAMVHILELASWAALRWCALGAIFANIIANLRLTPPSTRSTAQPTTHNTATLAHTSSRRAKVQRLMETTTTGELAFHLSG